MKCVVRILNLPNLSIYEKMILIVVASYETGKVGATISYREICEQGNMSITQAKNCVKSLVAKGLLKRERNKSIEGGNMENTYILKIETEETT